MRVLFMGSSGALSLVPFRALLETQWRPCAVALEAANGPSVCHEKLPLIIANRDSLAALAGLNDVTVLELSNNADQCAAQVSALQPDIILVSCFGRKLPDELLTLPAIGCFNLHPSLLPAYRGPAPLFWQFRDGRECFGITLHRISPRIDAGAIVAQTPVSMPDGISYRQASERLAKAGAGLLIDLLKACGRGAPAGREQDEKLAAYQGFPGNPDYRLSTHWSARRLYNFVAATAGPGISFPIEIENRTYALVQVLSFQAHGRAPLSVSADVISFPCRQGVVSARFVAAETVDSGSNGG